MKVSGNLECKKEATDEEEITTTFNRINRRPQISPPVQRCYGFVRPWEASHALSENRSPGHPLRQVSYARGRNDEDKNMEEKWKLIDQSVENDFRECFGRFPQHAYWLYNLQGMYRNSVMHIQCLQNHIPTNNMTSSEIDSTLLCYGLNLRQVASEAREKLQIFKAKASSLRVCLMCIFPRTSMNFSTVALRDREEVASTGATTEIECHRGNRRNRISHVENECRRGQLNPMVVSMMKQWYNQNLHHPYPSKEAVANFARVGGITVKQVKKWMANRRVRTCNTLSYNGTMHPRRLERLQREMNTRDLEEQPLNPQPNQHIIRTGWHQQ